MTTSYLNDSQVQEMAKAQDYFDSPENIVLAYRGLKVTIQELETLLDADNKLPEFIRVKLSRELYDLRKVNQRILINRDIEEIGIQEYNDLLKLAQIEKSLNKVITFSPK